MKKLLKMGALLAIIAIVFAGCPDGNGDAGDDPVVIGIGLRVASTETGATSGTKPSGLKPDDVRFFSANVTGLGAFNSSYSIDITLVELLDEDGEEVEDGILADLITVENVSGSSAKKVTVLEDYAGTFKVTATTVGTNASGNTISASWDIDVTLDKEFVAPDFTKAQWVIKNTGVGRPGVTSLDPKTTTSITGAVENNRYVIFNNEPHAWIDANANVIGPTHPNTSENNAFRDVTIMYMNLPFESDPSSWQSFGMEARIRIAGYRDSAPLSALAGLEGVAWAQARQGVAMVAIEDPANINPVFDSNGLSIANDAPWFIGPRMTASGQIRSYLRRAQNGTYGSVQFAQTEEGAAKFPDGLFPTPERPAGLTAGDLRAQIGDRNQFMDGGTNENTDKNYAFSDQEFIYRLTRTASTTYKVTVWTGDGLTKLVDDANAFSGTASPGAALTGDDPVYFAFLIYGVKAEISNIKLFYGSDEWTDTTVANATPRVETPRRVFFTHSDANYAANRLDGLEYADYNYAVLENNFPNPLILTPRVVPINLAQTVTWSIDSENILSQDGPDLYRTGKTAFGAVTVTATPTAGAVNIANSNLFKLFIEQAAASVTSVTIAPPQRTELTAGQSVTLSASALPVTAPQTVTWAVALKEDGGSAAEVATITTAGVLTAAAVAPDVDTVVTVTATSTVTTTVSGTIDITIKAPAANLNLIYEWKSSTQTTTVTLNNATAQLINGAYWQRAAGDIPIANTGVNMPTASRFMIGTGALTAVTGTTGTDHRTGEFDLSKKAKLSIEYENLSGNLLQIYLNNNTTSAANSVLTADSRIFNGGTGGTNTIIPAAGTLELTIDPATFSDHASLATAFFQIRCGDGSNPTTINIKSITLEYVATSEIDLHWNFQQLPTGWTNGNQDNATNNTDVDYGNGMTLLGTGNNPMRIVTGQSVPAHLSALGATAGYVAKNNNTDDILRVTGIPGSCTIKVIYAMNGNAGGARGVRATIGTDTMSSIASAHGTADALADAPAGTSVLTWNYTGTGGTLIINNHASNTGGIRIFDVFITSP